MMYPYTPNTPAPQADPEGPENSGPRNESLSPYDSTPNYYQSSYYRPEPAEPVPPPPPAPKLEEEKPKKRRGMAPYVASLLAVSLISGAAGGGASYLLMSNRDADIPASLVQDADAVQGVPGAQVEAEPEASTQQVPADSTPGASPGTGDIAGIVSKVSNSVVEVSTTYTVANPFFGETSSSGSGSGVILSADGYIATNNHVIENADEIVVRTAGGEEYEATFIGTDSKTDLAVLKVEATGLQPVTLADSDKVEVGQLAVAIGNPLGTLGGTVTDGIISAKDREITIDNQTMTLLQTSAAVNPGNSGGGLFNAEAELVGIVNAKSVSSSSGTSVEGLGFAIPSNTVKKITGDIINNGYVTGRPQIGISILEIKDAQTAMQYRVNEFGVYVYSVTRDNGLEAGDQVLSINGVEVENGSDISDAVAKSKIGDTLTFEVRRGLQRETISVPVVEEVPDYMEQLAPESEDL